MVWREGGMEEKSVTLNTLPAIFGQASRTLGALGDG